MTTLRRIHAVGIFLLMASALPTEARDAMVMEPYTQVLELSGVRFGYRVKRGGTASDPDEVLLRILNTSDHKVQVGYSLGATSVSGAEYVSTSQGGNMKPHSESSGELSGQYWIPFAKGERIRAVQLVNVTVNRIDRPWGPWRRHPNYSQLEYSTRCGELVDLRFNWYARFRNVGSQAVHFSFALRPIWEGNGTSGRYSLEPGQERETASSWLPILPEKGEQLKVVVADVRLGPKDLGRYIDFDD
jgi:hypothetical protein